MSWLFQKYETTNLMFVLQVIALIFFIVSVFAYRNQIHERDLLLARASPVIEICERTLRDRLED
jgi:predicted acyltransferase